MSAAGGAGDTDTAGVTGAAGVSGPAAGGAAEAGELLFVESNTTGTGMLALRIADRLGVRPVLLTSRPGRYAGLAEQPCDVLECDTNDLAALRAAVHARAAAGGGAPAGVVTTSEYYLEAVAALAGELGVPGNPAAALRTCRDKARTREVLTAAGLPQPRFAVLRDPAEAAGAVARVGLPCVVKPVDDSGSTNVLLCHTAEQASAQVAAVLAVTENGRGQPTARTVLVEQYLPQAELSAELFSVGGVASCLGVTQKSVTGGPYFVETQHVFPAPLPSTVTAEVVEVARQALKATGIEHGASHVELKLTPDGPAVVEINARLAGGMIPELVRLATGVELLEQQLRAAIGRPVDLTLWRDPRFAGIRFLLAGAPGVLEGVRGVAEARGLPGVDRVVVTAAPGAAVRPPRSFADRLGYVVATGTTAAEVESTLQAAAAAITITVHPPSPLPARM
jgi:biotin carboxylase